MNRYHVTFYYLATGMEGRPLTDNYGVVLASSEDAAKEYILNTYHPNNSANDRAFIKGCLTAKRIEA